MQTPLITRRGALIGAAGTALAGVGLLGCHKASASLTRDVVLREATFRGQPDSFLGQLGGPNPRYQVATSQFAGGNLIAEAMNGGALDVGGMSEIPPIFVAGNPSNQVRIIAVLQGDVNNQVVLAPKGSRVQAFAELRGKRVGYVRATTSHYILLRLLKEAGLSWRDIQPVALSPQDGLAAFQQGSLDAWIIYGVIIQQAREAGARVLTTGRGRLSGNYLIAASAPAIADPGKHAAISDYLQRYRRVLAWINADTDRWCALKSKATGVPVAYYQQEIRDQSARPALLPVSPAAVASQQAVADAFFTAKVTPAAIDVKPLWDDRFSSALT